jgi:hypothetical protein
VLAEWCGWLERSIVEARLGRMVRGGLKRSIVEARLDRMVWSGLKRSIVEARLDRMVWSGLKGALWQPVGLAECCGWLENWSISRT